MRCSQHDGGMAAIGDQLDEHHACWNAILAIVRSSEERVRSKRRCVVALAGSVAVGKSTFAAALSAEFNGATVVGTDAFLFPNHILALDGLEYDKGLPRTYNWDALRDFVIRCGAGEVAIEVPEYSHVAFNIVGSRVIEPSQVVIVEGINALQDPIHDVFDLRIYLDAPHEIIANWYVERFLQFIVAAETDRSSFYSRFVSLDGRERVAMARSVWDSINLPNLQAHIFPSKKHADVVVTLDTHHRLAKVNQQHWPSDEESQI
jgi:type I pantothenate kinase